MQGRLTRPKVDLRLTRSRPKWEGGREIIAARGNEKDAGTLVGKRDAENDEEGSSGVLRIEKIRCVVRSFRENSLTVVSVVPWSWVVLRLCISCAMGYGMVLAGGMIARSPRRQ